MKIHPWEMKSSFQCINSRRKDGNVLLWGIQHARFYDSTDSTMPQRAFFSSVLSNKTEKSLCFGGTFVEALRWAYLAFFNVYLRYIFSWTQFFNCYFEIYIGFLWRTFFLTFILRLMKIFQTFILRWQFVFYRL